MLYMELHDKLCISFYAITTEHNKHVCKYGPGQTISKSDTVTLCVNGELQTSTNSLKEKHVYHEY